VTDPDPTDLNKVTLQTSTRPGKHTQIAIEHGNLQWIFPLKLGGFSIVMLIHQRVDSIFISRIKYPTTLKKKQSVSVSENQTPGFYYCPKPPPIGGYHCYKSSRDYNQNSPIGY
jgi:hypothetical protein